MVSMGLQDISFSPRRSMVTVALCGLDGHSCGDPRAAVEGCTQVWLPVLDLNDVHGPWHLVVRGWVLVAVGIY
jgi:hypothetical protein